MEVTLCRRGEALKVQINGEVLEPLSFKSFRPTARNISDFAAAGVRLFSILSSGLNSILTVPYSLFGESWTGDHTYDFSVIDRQIDLFCANAPGCWFALMLQLDTRPWWLKSHPGVADSFRCLSMMAMNRAWREDARDYLQAVLRHVEEKYGDRFYGYFLLCGTTTEWFSHFDEEEPSREKAEAFLRASGLAVPPREELAAPGTQAFTSAGVTAYRRFHAHLISESVLYFAAAAQEVLQHRKLVGVYFGYLLELDGARLWNDGHLAYEDVFLSPDIDMISSPSSYAYRGKDSTSAMMLASDTLARHNKLYYLEFDHITHVAPATIEGILIPGGNNKCKNETETLDLMHRDFMLCAAKGIALWWFDMFEGWFYSESMMREIARMIEIQKRISLLRVSSCAEICVLVSGEALYGVNKNSLLNTFLLGQQRDGLARMGAPYDLFSLCDLPHLEKTYRLYILPDAFCLTPEQKQALLTLKEKGAHLLLQYAPGYLSGCMEELTGLTFREAPEETDVVLQGRHLSFPSLPAPCFSPLSGEVLGTYAASGLPAVVRKCNVLYSAVGNLPGEFLAQAARQAGVHLYSEAGVPVYVNSAVTGVYCHGPVTLTLPFDGVLEDVLSGQTYQTENGRLALPESRFASRLLLKKETEEIT